MWNKGGKIMWKKGGNNVAQQPQYKPEQPKEEAVEQPQQPQPQPEEIQQVEMKTYLMHITDGESAEKLVVGASNILEALAIFAERYLEICADWQLMNISVEEIEILQ
jgi:hypothetical protein